MKILVACEFSGIVRDAFTERGHEAWSCDILPSERPGLHLQKDVESILYNGWDMLIGFPPCTYLTNAGVRHLHDNITTSTGKQAKVAGSVRWAEMYKAANFFLTLKNAPIEKIALENPIPHRYARDIIGDYTQIIQPWMFGANETKATCLWLKNLPLLEPTNIVPVYMNRVHLEPPGEDRWKRRSRTFQGIANAIAEQWG